MISKIDAVDQRILGILVVDARISLRELAAQVGMSAPGVSERMRRLEERGVIQAYTAEIDPQALGYPLQAIVRIRPLPGRQHAVGRLIGEIAECCECDKVTGEDCYVARLHVRSMEHLDAVLDRIVDQAQTSTAIVKSQPVRRRQPRAQPQPAGPTAGC